MSLFQGWYWFFFLIFKLYLSNSVEDVSYDRDRSKILSSFKCDKIFMDSVYIFWLIGENLGGGKEGPPWYFEAQEYSRYWIGLKFKHPIVLFKFPYFQLEFPLFQFIFPKVHFNVPFQQFNLPRMKFNFPIMKSEFSTS